MDSNEINLIKKYNVNNENMQDSMNAFMHILDKNFHYFVSQNAMYYSLN